MPDTVTKPTDIRVLGDYSRAPAPGVAACRSCKAPILWFTTAAELRPMPVDAVPMFRVSGVYHEGPKARSIIFAVPHWVTCPQYKGWRRR